MLYEYALISVVIAAGYWGYFFVRRAPSPFAFMLIGTAVASLLGVVARDRSPLFGVLGAIGLGAGICLLVVGPAVRGLARRMANAERLAIAMRLFDIADILAPGSGVSEEKALVNAMRDIREGRVEQAVNALEHAKQSVPVAARQAIDERIAMLYLAACRWQDAITFAEANLLPEVFALGDVPRHDIDRGAAGEPSLRDALGLAPPVWVELLGAYGRLGNLDRAATMIARLEAACRGRDDAGPWVHRARLMFLALAGRPAAVRVLIEPRRAPHMSRALRTYWLAVAHHHHGDREAAAAAYSKARSGARGRARTLIDEALGAIEHARPIALTDQSTKMVEQLEATPPPTVGVIGGSHPPWATWVLAGSLLAVAAAIALWVGPSTDPGVLVRVGALVRGRIEAGEWWRVVSCVFVHVGGVHLAVNAIGLFVLGRISEDAFGSLRAVAIYGGAGIAGAYTSYLASPIGVSAGASGALFGVLGALLIELTLHRTHYRASWMRGMWGGLIVVTVAQVAIGFAYPVIDQWAHGAGLGAGVVLGAGLSPNAKWAKYGRYVAGVLAGGFVALSIAACVLVVATPLRSALDGPRSEHHIGALTITAPTSWQLDDQLHDPDHLIIIAFAEAPADDPPRRTGEWLDHAARDATERGFETARRASERVVASPPGWDGGELIASLEDAMGNPQHYRVVALAKPFGDTLVLVAIYAPDSVVRAAGDFFTELVGSIVRR